LAGRDVILADAQLDTGDLDALRAAIDARPPAGRPPQVLLVPFGDDRDLSRCIEIVRAAAAAEILPRFRRLRPDDVRAKTAPDDLVTEADLAAEGAMSEALARNFPEALIVGEEAVETDPGLLDGLPGAQLAFVIDPIDGTWNFAAGLSVFGVILAVIERGRTVAGVLYDPVMDDWIAARAGGGAWFERAGDDARHPLRIGGAGPADEAKGLVSPYNFPSADRERLAAQLTGFGRVDALRCSCHEYRMLAQGRVRFCLSGGAKVWDHAAGALVTAEAGGALGMLDGRAYAPGLREGRLLAADDAVLMRDLADRFSWLEKRSRVA
ncbi:MAG: inositol monophosphatase family protein, partial [Roseicyclus sp.]